MFEFTDLMLTIISSESISVKEGTCCFRWEQLFKTKMKNFSFNLVNAYNMYKENKDGK